jgi:uncharacterized BrkB/YihY/UPF0761 family membrane protein
MIFWPVFLYTVAAMVTAVIMYPQVQESWAESADPEEPSWWLWNWIVTILLTVTLGFAWPYWLVRIAKRIKDDAGS